MKKYHLHYYMLLNCFLIHNTFSYNSSTLHYNLALLGPFSGEFHPNKNQASNEFYEKLNLLNPDPIAQTSYIHFLFSKNKMADIVSFYDNHQKSFKNDPDIQLIFIQALSACNRTQEAHDILNIIITNFSHHQKIILYATQIYIRCKNSQKALNCIETYLSKVPKTIHNYLFHFLQSQAYMLCNDYYQALRAIKKSLKLYPTHNKAWILYASIQEKVGNIEQAIHAYEQFLTHIPFPQTSAFNQSLLQLKVQYESLKKETMLKSYNDAQRFYDQKKFQAALMTLNNLLTQNTLNSNERTKIEKLKIATLIALYDYTTAAHTLHALIKKDPHNKDHYESLYFLYTAGLPHKKVRTLLQNIAHQEPNALYPHLYLADMFTHTQQHQIALHHHTKALNITNNNTLKTKLYFNMATIYFQKKDFNQMCTTLKKVDDYNSLFAPAKNLHAYYHATTTHDFKKAHELIHQALEHDPHNSAYLDTLAVILYQENDIEKATLILTALTHKNPTSHASDLLTKIQNKDMPKHTPPLLHAHHDNIKKERTL